MEAPLQSVTVAITMKMLALVGVPAQVDGVLITIPGGYFEVAEACSGAKFVIAMIAFSVLVANVCFLSWPRRIGFVVMAVVVAILANGLRAFGTIYAASLTSVAAATGFDHIVYGWVFFGLVMAAVLGIGWRWFDRDPDAAWFDPHALGAAPRWRVDPLAAAGLGLALIVAGPATAKLVDARTDVLPNHIDLPAVPGWHRVALSDRAAWSPNYPGADHYLIGRYANAAGDLVDVAVAVYASQHEGKEIVGFGIGPLRENDRWVRIGDMPMIAGGKAIRVTAPGPVERVIASWYSVGGVVTASDKVVKLATLKARLLGGRQRAVAVHLSAEVLPGRDPVRAIDQFLTAIGPVDRFADRLSGSTG
jgi:EpsI family protein